MNAQVICNDCNGYVSLTKTGKIPQHMKANQPSILCTSSGFPGDYCRETPECLAERISEVFASEGTHAENVLTVADLLRKWAA